MTVLDTNLVSVMINPRDAERYPKTLALVESLLKTDGLSISAVTLFELRRGLEKLRLSGSGRSKLVKFEKLLEYVEVLGAARASFEVGKEFDHGTNPRRMRRWPTLRRNPGDTGVTIEPARVPGR